MTKRSKKNQKSQSKLKDFVVVTSVEDLEQAREYETLLRVNDIPAIIKEQVDQSLGVRSVAIMVPEDCLDEAHVVIESQNAYDDFYDFALEDETETDFDSSLFEDDF
jgi:ferredoxin-fold anticodon binding domain-containing protein